MPPPESKQAPLPLAADRAALSNRISLLLGSRTSLLKTLNPNSSTTNSSSSSSTTTTRRHGANPDDDEELWKGTRPNEGVGYVPDSKTASKDISKEDKMLRGRLLGKRRNGETLGRGRRAVVESESDEEEGRSGLGKRKRPKRAAVVEEEVIQKDNDELPLKTNGEDKPSNGDGDGDEEEDNVKMNGVVDEKLESQPATKNKKKKKKNKRKQEAVAS